MKVKASQMVKLFLALGVDTADQWDHGTLTKKVEKGISRFKEGDGELPDRGLEDLFNDVVAAQEAKTPVEVEDDLPKKEKPAKAAGTPKAGKGTRKPRAAAGERTAKSWSDYVKGWKKNPQPLTEKGDGVIRTIIDLLKKAGQDPDNPKPVTKEAVLDKLVAKFPGRVKEKMATTVNNQIPSRLLLVRHIHVWKGKTADGKTGYYIPGEGTEKQPKQPKEPKVPATRGENKPQKTGAKKGSPKAKAAGKKGAAASKKASSKKPVPAAATA